MTGRASTFAATALFVGNVATWAGAVALAATRPAGVDPFRLLDFVWGVSFLAFALVGWLVGVKRPSNPLGWLFLSAPLLVAVGVMLSEVIVHWQLETPAWLVMASQLAWISGAALLISFALVLLPTGEVHSRRWRFLPVGAIAALSGGYAFIATQRCFEIELISGGRSPTSCSDSSSPGYLLFDNPFPVIEPGGSALWAVVGGASFAFLIAMLPLGAVSLFFRYRAASGDERQQLRWLALLLSALLPMFVLLTAWELLAGSPPDWLEVLVMVSALVGIPGTMGVAILRYRLYAIDQFISRTVSYATITAIAVGLFALVTLAPTAVLDLGDAPPALIAVATLVAAGVFNPLRRRIQALVDRRFNRARYDAQVVADGFASRLREPRDLDRVTADLAGTVAATMRPDRLGLWVKA